PARARGRADDAFGRFAGGQPILKGHHSEKSARRARERGDAATRRALEHQEEAKRYEAKAREARAQAEIADWRAAMARQFRQSDFRPGDVIEYTWRDTTVLRSAVKRANATTLTQADSDNKIEYWRVVARIRDGQLLRDPGELDAPTKPMTLTPAGETPPGAAPSGQGRTTKEGAPPGPQHPGPGHTQPSGTEPAPRRAEMDHAPPSTTAAPEGAGRSPGGQPGQPGQEDATAQLNTTPCAQMEDQALEDEDSDLYDVLQALEGATDPLDLAYRHRAEQRAWEVDDERRRREPLEAARDRGQVIEDRLAGYGLNDDAPALSSGDLEQALAQMPAARPGAPTDEQWARIDAAAAAAEAFPATDEQRLAIEAVARRRLNTAIRALAGTGKSATLEMICRRLPDQRIALLAFNRGVVDDAKAAKAAGKYGDHVEPMTANGLAFQSVNQRYLDAGRGLKHRLPDHGGASRQTAQQIADLMHVYQAIQVGVHRLTPETAASLARGMLQRWCQSADACLGPQHTRVPTFLGPDNRQALFEALKPLTERMWADLTDPYGKLTYDHDYIVKQWALSGSTIPYDLIAWDEAQDVNPVLDGCLRAALEHGTQVVAVGDANQSIYSFRGATDALSHFPVDVSLTLTQSFRYGEYIADVGNRILRLLGARMRLKGLAGKPSELTELGPDEVDAVLTRTNATAVTEALDAVDRGKRVAVAGGLDEIREFLQAVHQLKETGKSKHKDLASFHSWAEVLTYVETEPEAAGSMRTIVQLIDNDTDGRLDQLLDVGGLGSIHLSPDGERLWISGTQPSHPDHQAFTDWLKDRETNKFGRCVYDGSSQRWYYQPGRHRITYEKNGQPRQWWVNNPASNLPKARAAIE
ncbi:DUF3560 domain-containing protein, partial [Streptomyces sp. NPDC059003]|uniref:DUF3560 domain-containing protein n=1 Tax=Streptomyces sp. NPDC059003 TaxID=3346691 RepID=UPI0036B6275B